ncbi:MAG: hypothetical protein MRT15_11200 [archaeon YNP-LCB-003-016]|uniref:hypothetical protein n=1 Tax=Candidatus Culexarchaeum yellowstonense TaxID=2928963 RepID=UPI0026EF6523|nr:hypothetical protein [Candidatus Culexarchaeum yellowstonense]MCR6692950.1 hypothetical protein [Candidatus Culexarchaeum yellowstonense]
MTYEFIPTLIQTTTWEAYTWEALRDSLSGKVWELIKAENIDEIFNLIRDEVGGHGEEEVKKRIREFISDALNAEGVVTAYDEVYQDIVLAILDLE